MDFFSAPIFWGRRSIGVSPIFPHHKQSANNSLDFPTGWDNIFFVFAVLGLELKSYTLSHSTSPVLCWILSR
jgi:hypothetical protein